MRTSPEDSRSVGKDGKADREGRPSASVSNGYAVVGGGDGADVSFVNSDLPDPAAPNNTPAPFWTDLDPSAGGAVRAGVLTDGTDSWTVLDWEDVPNFSDSAETNSFQIWIDYASNGDGQGVSFTYGDVTDGDAGFLTVGAENKFGNRGDAEYFDGVPVGGGSRQQRLRVRGGQHAGVARRDPHHLVQGSRPDRGRLDELRRRLERRVLRSRRGLRVGTGDAPLTHSLIHPC